MRGSPRIAPPPARRPAHWATPHPPPRPPRSRLRRSVSVLCWLVRLPGAGATDAAGGCRVSVAAGRPRGGGRRSPPPPPAYVEADAGGWQRRRPESGPVGTVPKLRWSAVLSSAQEPASSSRGGIAGCSLQCSLLCQDSRWCSIHRLEATGTAPELPA